MSVMLGLRGLAGEVCEEYGGEWRRRGDAVGAGATEHPAASDGDTLQDNHRRHRGYAEPAAEPRGAGGRALGPADRESTGPARGGRPGERQARGSYACEIMIDNI